MEHEQQRHAHQEHDEKEKAKSAHEKNIGMAVLAYLLFFIPLLTDAKNDPFVKFHVKQGLVLLLTGFAVSIVGRILPIIGWFIVLPLGSLAVLILWIIGVVRALAGTEKELPLVGSFAKYFTF